MNEIVAVLRNIRLHLIVATLLSGLVVFGCGRAEDDNPANQRPAFKMRIEQVVANGGDTLKIASDWLSQAGISHGVMYVNGNRLLLDRPLTDVEVLGLLNEAREFDILISNDVIEISVPPTGEP